MPPHAPLWAQQLLLGWGVVEYNGETYDFAILDRRLDFAPANFVVFIPDPYFLYLSDEVPRKYRTHVLRHELREYLSHRGEDGACQATLETEIAEVPRSWRREYLVWRRSFFNHLFWHYTEGAGKSIDDERLRYEILGSIIFLEDVLKRGRTRK